MHRHLPLSVQINGHQAATRLSFQPHHFSLSFKYLYLLYIMIQTPFKYNSNFKYPSNIIKTSLTVNFVPFHLVWNIHSSTNCRFCRSSVDFLLHPWSGVSESSPRISSPLSLNLFLICTFLILHNCTFRGVWIHTFCNSPPRKSPFHPLTPTYLTPNKRHALVLTVKTKVWQIFTRRTNFPFLSTVHWTESNFGKNEKRWQTRAESKYKHYSDPFYMFSSSYISVLCVSL